MRWQENRALPPCVAALMAALAEPGAGSGFPPFSDAEWDRALHYFDRQQLTLLLPRAGLPAKALQRLERNASDNRERIRRLEQAFLEIQGAIRTPFLALKGFANWERFTPDPYARVQYDLDLFCPETAEQARDALLALGYESAPGGEKFPTDHLPRLVRKTGWQWRGDFFDPEIPLSVELHFRLWDEETEGFPAPGIENFWSRRVEQKLGGATYQALHPADALGYSALHLLRHLLRGDVRGANVHEIAWFLETQASNDAFWTTWRDLHGAELRRLQAVCFRLAAAWFDCRMHPIARVEAEALGRRIRQWFEQFAASPAESLFRPNKDELWLHLCLLDSFRKKAAVLRRRLLPARLPGPLDVIFIPEKQMTPALRIRKQWEYARYAAGRAWFHLRALAPTLSRMLRTRF
ncbi:MAG TPA: nucleotidyltransferase family protein [Bryobacteraceae bacterium]|nr:nucleotidyltransferase family protein [Bryobacteraceae bacterium]